MKDNNVLLDADLPLPSFIKGKVRDTYDLGEYLLIIASDRISAFDVILPCGIPNKGEVLNRLSAFWFGLTADIVPNHFIEVVEDPAQLDNYLPPARRFAYPNWLTGRSMIVKKVDRFPIECIVRGYLSGSAWAEYELNGTISNMAMPSGLEHSQQLLHTLFTPTTKGEDGGHDELMTREELTVAVGGDKMVRLLEKTSVDIFDFGCAYARERDLIIADTKFEFGLDKGVLTLIDEILTPDSSRFWDTALYKLGQAQDSYDKQPVRDFLEQQGWNKMPPPPMLPSEVIAKTQERYETAYYRITGYKLPA